MQERSVAFNGTGVKLPMQHAVSRGFDDLV